MSESDPLASTPLPTAQSGAGDVPPAVACVCLDFLKRDMLHVYRQIDGLTLYRPGILARKRENEGRFPFPKKRIWTLKRAPSIVREARRFWAKSVKNAPVQIGADEVKDLIYGTLHFDARVVHVYFGHVAVQLLPFIRACPRPVIVSFHGADAGVDSGKPAHRAALLEVLQRATLVLARSEALLGDLAALGCPPGKLRLHRTGIPLGSWPFTERQPPAHDGEWRFLQACRLVEKKGLSTSLEAFAAILKERPAARLTIAGDGPLLESLRAQVASLGICERVKFPGFLDQDALRKEVLASHVFIHPSITGADGNREGVPNAMLEAMATGTPVLATRHGGIPEAVTEGESGFLVAEGDGSSLAARALELTSNPDLYRKMAKAAHQEVTSKFEQTTQCNRLESLYDESVEKTQ